MPQVMHVQRSETLRCRFTKPFLVLGDRAFARINPSRVVDAVQRVAAIGKDCGSMLPAATLDDRPSDRVEHADVILLILPAITRNEKHAAVQLRHLDLPTPIQPYCLALTAQAAIEKK